jgi:dolichol-phosphate mannosyltransferase
MDKRPIVSFIIPVYGNQGSIKPTFDDIANLFERKLVNFQFEVVFVNDCSFDQSIDEIKNLRKEHSNVKYISFSRNFGQVSAIIAGARHCSGDIAVIMSADRQDPVSLVEDMIKEWQNGNKIVIGTRIDREDKWFSKFTSNVFYSLMNMANKKIPKGGFDFVLMDRVALDEYNSIDERNRFFQGDVLWLGFPVKFLQYTRLERKIGKSQWSFSKKIKYFIDGLLNTSYFPIRIFSLLGLFTSFSGFIYAIVIVCNRFFNNTPFKGWAPIMILILLIGGMIMLMLGIIGEYIWRIYDEVRNRKVYIIQEKEGFDKK